MANEIVGVQAPYKYVPTFAASCNKCSLGVNGKGGGTIVRWHLKCVDYAVHEVFLHGGDGSAKSSDVGYVGYNIRGEE